MENIKIAVLIRRLYRTGGAEESILKLCEYLSSKGHEIALFSVSDGNVRNDEIPRDVIDKSKKKKVDYFQNKIPMEVFILSKFFESFTRFNKSIKKFNPQLIISQHELGFVGSLLEVPHIHILRDYFYIYDNRLRGSSLVTKPINYLVSYINSFIVRRMLNGSDFIVANSNYVSNKYDRFWDIDSKVIYPLVDTKKYFVENTGENILHVNPSFHKGIDITLKIAERLENWNFIIVGSNPSRKIMNKMMDLPNVDFLGYVENMKEIYRKTRIALMPSRWPEPFGRVPIEAGISGIPTISSGKGGLKESIGSKELIVEKKLPAHYIKKIREVENDYDRYSKIAYENARDKDYLLELKKFDELIKQVK